MPNLATPSALVETATKCRAMALSSPSPRRHQARAARALVSVSSVVKVLEQMTNSVSRGSRSRTASAEIGSVHVGDEAERHVALAVVAQRLVRHHRAEVGAADADVDDVANAPAAVTGPLAAAHALATNAAMRSSTACTSGTTFLPSTRMRSLRRRAQGDVQHRALLGSC